MVERATRWLVYPMGNWDAVHFIKIAMDGYRYEHSYAFFPGLPLFIRMLATSRFGVALTDGFLCPHTLYLLCGVLISNVSFVLSCWVLWKWSRNAEAVYWFMMMPANVFFSAVYTESLFTLFLLLGLLFLSRHKWWSCAAAFFVASCVRSNGFLFSILLLLKGKWFLALFLFVPYAFHNLNCYRDVCILNVSSSSWCHNSVPVCYSYIQQHYWHNGLLAYWTWNNLPNFALATPMMALCAHLAWTRLRATTRRTSWNTLWLFDVMTQLDMITVAMCVLCFFSMNVQIMTRFVAVMPNLYVHAANIKTPSHKWLLQSFFVSYALLGCILFPLFYPWT